jgi:hypothetical protein
MPNKLKLDDGRKVSIVPIASARKRDDAKDERLKRDERPVCPSLEDGRAAFGSGR